MSCYPEIGKRFPLGWQKITGIAGEGSAKNLLVGDAHVPHHDGCRCDLDGDIVPRGKHWTNSRIGERVRTQILLVNLEIQLLRRFAGYELGRANDVCAERSIRIALVDHERDLRIRLNIARLTCASRGGDVDASSVEAIPHGNHVNGTVGLMRCERSDV